MLYADLFYEVNKLIIMKRIVVFLVITIALITHRAYAQDYTFRVLANKGINKAKKAGSKWTVLKTGSRLNEGDKLKLSNDSYLGLVHANGKTLELKQAGSYDIKILSDQLGANTKSMVSKYADFVISKMAPEEIEKNRKKYASIAGSGERGLYDTDIHLYLPKTLVLLNTKAIISWNYKDENEVFIVTIKNIFGEKILVAESTKTSYTINYEDDNVENGSINNIITIEVSLKSNASIISQEIAIRLIDSTDEQGVRLRLTNLKSNLGELSSLNNLILAEFYEENGLVLDAITSYEDALLLSPEIEYFREVYDEFLIRNELKKPE